LAADVPTTFFSYSHEDSEFALRLAEDLKAEGAAVWIDQLDISPGEEWDNAVEDALANSPRMLLILSPASVKSKKVRNEIAFALDEQKALLPVFYQDCAVPLQLRRIQHIDFRTNYDAGLKRLVAALGMSRGASAGSPKRRVEKPSRTSGRANQKAARQLVHVKAKDQLANQPFRDDDGVKLLRIEEELHKRVVSQDQAISALARAIRRSRAGLRNPDRPTGAFLFLGPTGVGKTEVARALAQFLFGSEKSLLRFDMSEFMERHSVSRLIGSPPGYVGYEERGQLTERVRRAPYSVILLDEIEKAHPDFLNLLLTLFDEGQLADAAGEVIDFRNTVIIMTSSVGASLQRPEGLSFQPLREQSREEQARDRIQAELKRVFSPRFLDHLDEIVIFRPLTKADLLSIMEILVRQMNSRLSKTSMTVTLTEQARNWILDNSKISASDGARPLRRALQRYVEDPLSEIVIQLSAEKRPAFMEIYPENDGLYCRPVGEELAVGVLLYALPS
jgi:ATP-dependent Clp protease ATP-binding subunit ClpA